MRGLSTPYSRSARNVQHHEDHRVEQHGGLHQRIVAVEDRLHHQPADAGPGEDRLDDHVAAEQRTDLQRRDADRRGQRVLQHVQQQHAPARQPLCLGEQHVVGAQHLDHRGAGHPHQHRGHRQRERERRQRQMAQRVDERGGSAGQQAVDQQKMRSPRRVRRRSRCGRTPANQCSVTENSSISSRPSQNPGSDTPSRAPTLAARSVTAAAPHARQQAERNADGQREDGGGQRQFDGRGQPVGDHIQHRPAMEEAAAEITVQRAPDEARRTVPPAAGRAPCRGAARRPARAWHAGRRA